MTYLIDSDTLAVLETFLPPQYTVAISNRSVQVILTDCIPGEVTVRDTPWPYGLKVASHLRCTSCGQAVVLTHAGYVCEEGHGGMEESGMPIS